MSFVLRLDRRIRVVALSVLASLAAGTVAVADAADDTQLSVAVITHAGPGDSFWTIAENGARQAAKDLGAEIVYQASGGDVRKQVQMINAAAAQKPSAIVTTLTNPGAFAPAIKKAVADGIPVFSLNSGTTEYQQAGSLGHVGEDEATAGEGVGARFNEMGSKHLVCVLHEQGNIGLENYCNGVKKTFAGQYESMYIPGVKDIAGSKATIRAKLSADPSIDAMYVLLSDATPSAVQAAEAANSKVKIANWSLTPQVLDLIGAGKVEFAEDQQPWLQGYLSVSSAIHYAQYRVAPGAAILTGPNFVTKDQVELLSKLMKESVR
ncbi:substrate-binding domain-containing protein [Shinella zoogloeoides]|uniref:substrate-binding domain-containing protein n=1 Tax=Shinella zoogloeoides TaxID=352475 RepID=UPI0028A7D5EF|nr:substrate-binding domain-containing protein [Shinella zoogloeoides]